MKIVPVVFGIDVKDNFPIFFGAFYKFVYYAHKNNWPIIAQEEYFKDPEYYEQNFSVTIKEVLNINEIPQINTNILNEVESYQITDDETQKVIEEFSDKETAWIKLMNYKNKALYGILKEKLEIIIKKHKDIKALVVWRHNKTIETLAKKFHLKLIEMELSGIRIPQYNFGLSYFQFSNKYSNEELNKRYSTFRKEIQNKKIKLPLLSRSDLISTLVTKENLKYFQSLEEFDFGIALGLQKDFETLSSQSITNEEIMNDIDKYKKDKKICIRKHPSNYNMHYKNEEYYTIDTSENSIEFISKCQKIVSSVSNINFEAMLFGKTTYTLGKMPFADFSFQNLDIDDINIINPLDLNFLVFCYYTPFSLCLDSKYIEFRLSNPSELEIYLYHYNYLKNNKLLKTGQNVFKSVGEIKNEIDKLKKDLNNCQSDLAKKIEECENLKLIYNGIINSASWRLTKPLREFKKIIKK